MADDFRALVEYVYALHGKLGALLLRELPDATDAWYHPHEGGALEAYLQEIDAFGDRFGLDVGKFYPEGGDGPGMRRPRG